MDETLLGHLAALRRSLLRAAAGVAALLLPGFLAAPAATRALVRWAVPERLGALHYFAPLEAFRAQLHVGFVLALAAAWPWVALQAWAFVRPGLREEEVAHLQAELQDARGDLLDVGGEFVFDVVEPGGDVAARRHGDGARVGRGDPGGEGAAAGVARHQEARGVDLGAGLQVVEAADGVPGAPGAEPFARERELLAHHVVVGAESAAGVFDIAELLALALLDGVDDEDGEALEDEAEGGGLVGVAGLALLGVAADDEDARDLALPSGGEIEVGRDGPARAAEVVEVLDCVAVVGVGAGHHGVEGRAGREAEDPGDLPPERVDVAAGVGLRADGAEALRAGGVGFPDLVDVVFVDDVAEEGCGRGGGVFHG